MVEEDRPTEELTPERRLARRILQSRGLSPPVPVEALAAERMEVQQEFFPADCDAVVFGLTDEAARPRLILNKQRPLTRRRFTLAHELGHFFIAWHLGMIVCHTDLGEQAWDESSDGETDVIPRTIEREANSFASELLLPRDWLREILTSEPVGSGIERVQIARVSPAAACLAAIEVLPAGHMLVLLDNASHVRYLFRTTGTDVPSHFKGGFLDPSSFDVLAVERARIQFGSQTIYWWRFEQRSELIESRDTRGASELLDAILNDVVPRTDLARVRARINGIVGSAKNRSKDWTAESLHAELQQRFAGRPDLREIESHAEFRLFLSRKAYEIADEAERPPR